MGTDAMPTLAKEYHLSGVTFPQSSHPCSWAILSRGHLAFHSFGPASAVASLKAAWLCVEKPEAKPCLPC